MKHLLILGGGAAGLAAAVTGLEAGARVTVLEKRRYLCGNGRYAEGMFAAGSRLQRRLNIDARPEELFRRAMEYSHWRADARLVRSLIDRSGETVDWLMGLGVPFSRLLHHMPNQTPEVFHMAYPAPTGLRVTSVLEARCRELGAELLTEAPARSLLLENGAVAGAAAELRDEKREFRADAVLICTGGFAGNPELMRRMIPGCDPDAYAHLKGIAMEGDGYRMASSAGADTPRDIAIEGCAPVYFGRGEITAMIRRPDALWINALGQRFCDESICSDFILGQNAVARQPGRMCWALLDAAEVRRARDGQPGMMAPPEASDNGMGGLYSAIELGLRKGDILRADAPEALAQAAGIDPAVLTEELDRYNAACSAGHDELFGKDRRSLIPLREPPFYAVRAGMDIITTHGGIRVDEHMRVLTPDRHPIPGLFSAGIDISGVDSGDYSVALSGHAFGFAVTGGRRAAEEMLR
ncbi:MAG: FAD-dependent oxidoreductase [Oscillospiraceae bacterium]|nr:FAD-dependent oxidoreductase [Oscillospiraceae bacterium]